MKNRIRSVVGVLIIVFGVMIYFYPDLKEYEINRRTEQIVDSLKNKEEKDPKQTEEIKDQSNDSSETQENIHADDAAKMDSEAETDEALSDKEALYEEMEAYNKRLVEEGQELLDAWSYEQTPFDMDLLDSEDEAIGYITIPDMDVTLPLYIGASSKNMALGATVLSETSMPIGGENTNCVIAGHRGYSGAPYFRDIENLKEGSDVFITNPWETLSYRVVSISVIDPDDVASILIQPGKDMVTLLTCHPYMSHGKYRYVVYCERVDDSQKDLEVENKETETPKDEIAGSVTEEVTPKTDMYGSSSFLIKQEKLLRWIVPVIVVILLCVWIICKKRKR
jgi:sortase A